MRSSLVPIVAGWGLYWLLWSLPPSKHVTTLLPRLTIRAFFADLKRSSLVFTWENISGFDMCTRSACDCAPVLMRVYVCVCVCGVWIAMGERGHAVLSIKTPALCFHTVEQQAGPIVEDMASYCRPDRR